MLINEKREAFTIVELLVVIVVIGILAAITIVSYSSINTRAITAVLESDLDSGNKLLKMYNVEYGYYPDSIDSDYCPEAPTVDDRYCLKASKGTTLSYSGGGQVFILTSTHTASALAYQITENGTTTAVAPSGGSSANTFAKAWGGTSQDFIGSIVKADGDGFAVTGYVDSNFSTTGKLILAKFNSDGSMLWNSAWNGTKFDNGSTVIKASDGGYVVVGQSQSFAVGNSDVLLVKFSSEGMLVWNKNIGIGGGTKGDAGYGIVEATAGGYVLTGGTANGSTNSIYDVFLSKFDVDGNVLWTRTWGASGNDYGRKVINTSDGGFAVTGWAPDARGSGCWDAFINKYTSDGTLSWSRLWGGTASEQGNDIVQTSNGDFVVTGYTDSFTAGGNDMFLTKFSSTGELIWSKTWGGTGVDRGNGLIISNDGNYVVSGYTGSFGAGSYDAFLAKYSTNGELIWSKTWGGASVESAGQLIQNSDNSFVTASYTVGFGAVGYDALFLKFKSDGTMNNCGESMCKTVTVTEGSPIVTVVSDPSGFTINNTPAVTVGTPSATVSTFSGTFTDIINP